MDKPNQIFIGETRKAFTPTYRDVVIREEVAGGKMYVVSFGFDRRGNDITALLLAEDILPRTQAPFTINNSELDL